MRCFFTAPLVVASLTGYVYGHRHGAPSSEDGTRVGLRRKTIGFGPAHPHAAFRSSPYQIQTNGFLPVDSVSDPLEVARLFVEDSMLSKDFVKDASKSYKIRKDSYTDKATGVTHVYVRQLVNGLEVADGDMNINVKDGMVISYGNSVCHVAVPLCYSANPHFARVTSSTPVLLHNPSSISMLSKTSVPRPVMHSFRLSDL